MTRRKDSENSSDKKMVESSEESHVTESYAGDSMESISDLMGSAEIAPKEDLALLRLDPRRLHTELMRDLKIGKISGMGPLVLGPYKLRDIEGWASNGYVRAGDLVQVPYRRWLPASEFFDVFPKGEMTSTVEVTSSFTLSGSKTVEMTKTSEMDSEGEVTPSQESDVLELEDEVLSPAAKQATSAAPAGKAAPSAAASATPRVPASQTQTIVMPVSTPPKRKPQVSSPSSSRALMTAVVSGLLLVVIFVAVRMTMKSKSQLDTKATQTTASNAATPLDFGADWPDYMQPLPTESLVNGDDALMTRLSPILAKVRFGHFRLDESEFATLRRLAAPGTASWVARRTAANILAIAGPWQGSATVQQAIEVLRPIYEASPDDFITVTNLAILTFENGDLPGAEELGQIALRLCQGSSCWFSNFLMGNIKARGSQWQNAEKFFQEAATDFADPVAVFGVWAQTVSREDGNRHGAKARALIERAIWGDPDRFLLSPLPDALGSAFLFQRLTSRMEEFFSQPVLALSAGQQNFLKWRFAMLAGKATLDDGVALIDGLGSESAPLSQLLTSYLQAIKGDLEGARERLGPILVLLKENQPVQGWPWTLAGDLQAERGFLDQALIFYQGALGRYSRDRGAVYGLGQLMRKKADFQGARQKFAEAAAMDAQYVLPKLRVSRFEWHRRLRYK